VNRLRYFLLAALPLAAVWLYALNESATQLRSLIDRPAQQSGAGSATQQQARLQPPAIAADLRTDPAASAVGATTSERTGPSNAGENDAVASHEIRDSDVLPLLGEYLGEATGQETQEILEAVAEFVYPSN
jgi:hypothetical protein